MRAGYIYIAMYLLLDVIPVLVVVAVINESRGALLQLSLANSRTFQKTERIVT